MTKECSNAQSSNDEPSWSGVCGRFCLVCAGLCRSYGALDLLGRVTTNMTVLWSLGAFCGGCGGSGAECRKRAGNFLRHFAPFCTFLRHCSLICGCFGKKIFFGCPPPLPPSQR